MKIDYLSFTQALRGAKNAQSINASHGFVYVKIKEREGYVLHKDSELAYRAPFRVIEPDDSDVEFIVSLDLYKSISHFASLPNLVGAVVGIEIEDYNTEVGTNVMSVTLEATLQAGDDIRGVTTKQAHVCYTGEVEMGGRFVSIIGDIDTDLELGEVDLTGVVKAFNLMGISNVTEVGKLGEKFILVGQDTLAEVDLEFGSDFIDSLIMPGDRMGTISKLISNFKGLKVGAVVGEDCTRLVLIETLQDTAKVKISESDEVGSEIPTNSGGLLACLEISIPSDIEMNLQVVQAHQNIDVKHILDLDCKLTEVLIKGIIGSDSSRILELHLTDLDEVTALFAGSLYSKTTIPAGIIDEGELGSCIKVTYSNISSWIGSHRKLEFHIHREDQEFGTLAVVAGGTRLFLAVAIGDSEITVGE
jgi:hypothetical protein